MTRRSSKLLLVWLISIAITVVLPVIGYRIGKAGDCSPGQIDGQCGLSTFIWSLYGVIGGALVFVCTTVCVVISMYRRRKAA